MALFISCLSEYDIQLFDIPLFDYIAYLKDYFSDSIQFHDVGTGKSTFRLITIENYDFQSLIKQLTKQLTKPMRKVTNADLFGKEFETSSDYKPLTKKNKQYSNYKRFQFKQSNQTNQTKQNGLFMFRHKRNVRNML